MSVLLPKYTFVVPADGHRAAILRHDEPWHEQREARNALHAMPAGRAT